MLFFYLFSCRSIPKGDASQPDIILVSIDTLRADHVSSYGYERKTTPWPAPYGYTILCVRLK